MMNKKSKTDKKYKSQHSEIKSQNPYDKDYYPIAKEDDGFYNFKKVKVKKIIRKLR